jgi:hypothetical protein
VHLAGAASTRTIVATFAVTDPGLAQPRAIKAELRADYNYDVAKAASAEDGFDTPENTWASAGDTALDVTAGWERVFDVTADDVVVFDVTKSRWLGPNPGALSDQWLVTPALEVSASDAFEVDLTHRFSFEAGKDRQGQMHYFDGGVVELSTDGGATWQDAAELGASPSYVAALETGAPDEQTKNPLRGRKAYAAQSADYPAFKSEALSFGTKLAGKTVRVRFRIGTDESGGAEGWDISHVAVKGITNTPFPKRVPAATTCTN